VQIPTNPYYEAKERISEEPDTSDVVDIFHASRQNDGTRKKSRTKFILLVTI
jgi:putative transposase